MTADAIAACLRDLGVKSRGAAAQTRTVTAIAYDSRQVLPGAIFVALRGLKADGTAFASQALSRGASAIVSESEPAVAVAVPWLVVDNARRALALLAAEFYSHPSCEMRVVGVTGTNGKTTTGYLLASIFEAAGIRCGLLGTVTYRVGTEERDATRTTPEAPDVQGLLREMRGRHCDACVLEVSSHALALDRVAGMRFAAGVFTNLTRDHLDFHADMEAYFQAKRRLFEMLPADAPAVINLDDPRGQALIGVGGRSVTYALAQPADVTPGPISSTLGGLAFEARTPGGTLAIESRLVGRPNAYNVLAAVATAAALDVPLPAIADGIRRLAGVPGRFEVASGPQDDVTVVVDYAHTDDALRKLLETARALAAGRLITVFGCGGDRDRTKRPLMGAVADRLSDVLVITSDNPRSEDPARIIEEIRRGITPDTRRLSPDSHQVLAIADRRAAIGRAIDLARPGDVVLVAGKGHERTQHLGDRVLPFDDAAVAREALGRRRAKSIAC